MAVNLSFIGGAGWQFFDNNGDPLSGGKIYTYAAGTTTPLATYTDRTGSVANTNPIILDAAGRTPQQIWSTEGLLYKYVVTTATDVSVRTWDNIGGSVVASDLAQDLAAPTGSGLVGLTGFKGQIGTVSDLAGGDGADWIGFTSAGANAVARAAQDKMRDIVCVKDFGAVGDGVTDDSQAFLAATTYMASAASAGRQIPALYIPAGNYLISEVNVFGSPFSLGTPFEGVHFYGDGPKSTIIKCAITSTATENYLASFANCKQVSFSKMTFNMTVATGKGIKWVGSSSSGSWFNFTHNSVEGTYSTFFNVTGSVLGSETYWENNEISVPNGGVFFSSLVNPQSLNHTFIGNSGLVFAGDVFKMQAGGNIRVYGGYFSLGPNSRFFAQDGTLSSNLGVNNRDILFSGVRFETFGGSVNTKIVTCASQYDFEFHKCSFSSVNVATGVNAFVFGENSQRGGVRIIFNNCIDPDLPTTMTGGVVAKYLDCYGINPNWPNWLTLTASTVSNGLSPNVDIVGCQSSANDTGVYPALPVDCSPGRFVNSFAAKSQAGIQQAPVASKFWVGRAGVAGGLPGLVVGGASTYSSFTVTLPYGAVVRRISLSYNGFNEFNQNKTFKVTDYSDTIIFVPETTFAGNTPGTVSSANLFYVVDTDDKRAIKIWGKAALGGADYGYVVIEYI